MLDGEAELIMRTIADNLQTYDQVTEVCSAETCFAPVLTRCSAVIVTPPSPQRAVASQLRALSSRRDGQRPDSRHIERNAFISCTCLPRMTSIVD